MITPDTIQSVQKESIPGFSQTLSPADVGQLVEWLSEKDDNFRYTCFLLLQSRSQSQADVYPFWETFAAKLESENSYQRSLGLMLIAENVRWDQAGKFDALADRYLSFCDDEKPVTVRQCIQGLCKIVPHKHSCLDKVVSKLLSINLAERKETQRKILLLDILSVLAQVQSIQPDPRIMPYFQSALTGSYLDEKAKRAVEKML